MGTVIDFQRAKKAREENNEQAGPESWKVSDSKPKNARRKQVPTNQRPLIIGDGGLTHDEFTKACAEYLPGGREWKRLTIRPVPPPKEGTVNKDTMEGYMRIEKTKDDLKAITGVVLSGRYAVYETFEMADPRTGEIADLGFSLIAVRDSLEEARALLDPNRLQDVMGPEDLGDFMRDEER